MPGFTPGIYVFAPLQFSKTWMAGPSPVEGCSAQAKRLLASARRRDKPGHDD